MVNFFNTAFFGSRMHVDILTIEIFLPNGGLNGKLAGRQTGIMIG